MEHTTLPVTRIALAVAVVLAVLFVPQWLRSRGRGRDQAAHASAVLRENILTRHAHANVARAAAPFREQAQAILSKLSRATTFPLPAGNNNVVFYVVTDSTTLSSGEIDVGLSGLPASHPFAGLLNSAQALITEVRRAS